MRTKKLSGHTEGLLLPYLRIYYGNQKTSFVINHVGIFYSITECLHVTQTYNIVQTQTFAYIPLGKHLHRRRPTQNTISRNGHYQNKLITARVEKSTEDAADLNRVIARGQIYTVLTETATHVVRS